MDLGSVALFSFPYALNMHVEFQLGTERCSFQCMCFFLEWLEKFSSFLKFDDKCHRYVITIISFFPAHCVKPIYRDSKAEQLPATKLIRLLFVEMWQIKNLKWFEISPLFIKKIWIHWFHETNSNSISPIVSLWKTIEMSFSLSSNKAAKKTEIFPEEPSSNFIPKKVDIFKQNVSWTIE